MKQLHPSAFGKHPEADTAGISRTSSHNHFVNGKDKVYSRSGSKETRGSTTTAANGTVIAQSAAVSVSFAADPSMNLVLSHNDFKALTMSMAQKPNVTSLSLQGNILSNAAVIALCNELSGINCRLTSLNLAMCGLGNENAVRIVSAAISHVHNRRATIPNPQGSPSALRPSDRRVPLDQARDYLQSANIRGGGERGNGRYSRSGSASRGNNNANSYQHRSSSSSSARPATGRSGSVGTRSSSKAAAASADVFGTYGYNGGLRVLDLSLNHITNEGALAIASAFNEAALYADLNAADPLAITGGTFVQHHSGRYNNGGAAASLHNVSVSANVGVSSIHGDAYCRSPSAAPSSVFAPSISATLTERARRNASPNRYARQLSTGGVSASGLISGLSEFGMTGAPSTVSATEGSVGLHSLVLRFNRIKASGVQALLRATSDLRVLDVRYCALRLGEVGGGGHHDAKDTEASGFSALLQGIADSRTVRRLLLDGNGATTDQLEQLERHLAMSTVGSLRFGGVTATALIGPLPSLDRYIRARRPQPGELYPPEVVEEATRVLGDTLYVRGELRDVNVKRPQMDWSPCVDNAKRSTSFQARKPRDAPREENTATEQRPMRSQSAANVSRSRSGTITTKLLASRVEGIEVSATAARRCEESFIVPVQRRPLLGATGMTVSRRGLLMEGDHERPVCGPCPTVNVKKLTEALRADQRRKGADEAAEDGGFIVAADTERGGEKHADPTARIHTKNGRLNTATSQTAEPTLKTSRSLRAMRRQSQTQGNGQHSSNNNLVEGSYLAATNEFVVSDEEDIRYSDGGDRSSSSDEEPSSAGDVYVGGGQVGSGSDEVVAYIPPSEEYEVVHDYHAVY